MAPPRTERLLSFARKLQRAATLADLVRTARDEAREATGYVHSWLLVADEELPDQLRLIDVSSDQRELVWEVAPVLPIKGDPLIEEVTSGDVPVVVPDARTDPRTNKDIVAKLQNRTLVNVPLRLMDKPLGVFGVGTFGDEGCRPPDPEQLDYLVGMASQIVVAASRIRFLELRAKAEKDRQDYERRLMQMQKLESLGLLAGGIAHDFNNLLTVVMSSAALALPMATTPALLAELKAIEAAATRGQDLTRQLLAMSRNQALNLRPLDVNMQLGQLTELARRIMPENINFDLVQGPALPVVEGDASQIDQVFMNLFINARNAMPQGGRLSVETKEVLVDGKFVELHPQAKPGRYVLCTVTDTGTGMAKDVLDHIFEPFFSASGKRAGTGLGLAVAYGVVQQHLGMIHCQSEVGLGTTFKVYLPVPEQVGSTVDARVEPAVVQGKEHVLVADDDDLVRGVLVRILERAGFQTTAVADGDSACDQAAKRTFDAYILDVVMPGLPCRDVVERIRGLRPGARILLSSGYTAESATTAFAREAGLDLINKPYDPDRLIRTIRRVIGERVPEPPPP